MTRWPPALPAPVPTVAMVAVVAVSNVAVKHPIGDWLTWGAFTYPLAFLVTDLTNRTLGPARCRRVVYAGFAFGVAASAVLADVRIAAASGAAFLASQLLDIWIFDRLRRGEWWRAPLFSSVASMAADTALFFALAFAFTGLPWVGWAAGDYAVKLAMAGAMLTPYRLLMARLPMWREAPAA